VIDAVIHHGTVVIGIPWLEDMYQTDERGRVIVGGSQVGGHCLYVRGWDPAKKLVGSAPEELLTWRNSWGPAYGVAGDGYITPADLESLLKQQGEACIPVHRHYKGSDPTTS
jgi:C1A family cysteine protease